MKINTHDSSSEQERNAALEKKIVKWNTFMDALPIPDHLWHRWISRKPIKDIKQMSENERKSLERKLLGL